MKVAAAILVGALGATISASAQNNTDSVKAVDQENPLARQDQNGGQGRFWVDEWMRTHSPVLSERQRRYNSFLQSSFRGLIGPGLSAPEGIELLSPQPPGRRGIQGGQFAVPINILEDGVLTSDTVFLTFFSLGIEWNAEARYVDSDCASAKHAVPTLNCDQYRITWTSPSDPPLQFGEGDPFLYGVRHVALQKALAALRRLQALIPSVVTVTAGDARWDAVHDAELYAERNAQCLRLSLFNTCVLDVGSIAYPFDWMTAEVDSTRLTPKFTRELTNAEIDARAALSSSERLREISQDAVYGAQH
jgi:hypothetical protein